MGELTFLDKINRTYGDTIRIMLIYKISIYRKDLLQIMQQTQDFFYKDGVEEYYNQRYQMHSSSYTKGLSDLKTVLGNEFDPSCCFIESFIGHCSTFLCMFHNQEYTFIKNLGLTFVPEKIESEDDFIKEFDKLAIENGKQLVFQYNNYPYEFDSAIFDEKRIGWFKWRGWIPHKSEEKLYTFSRNGGLLREVVDDIVNVIGKNTWNNEEGYSIPRKEQLEILVLIDNTSIADIEKEDLRIEYSNRMKTFFKEYNPYYRDDKDDIL